MSSGRCRAPLLVCAALTLTACGGGGRGDGGGETIPPFDLYSSVAAADINGDGLPDVVAAYTHIAGPPPHPGFVAVYLQNGANPGHFLPASTYAVGNDPVSLAVGDLDGDGRADIAVYGWQSGKWFIRQSTDGQFMSGAPIFWGAPAVRPMLPTYTILRLSGLVP